MRVYNIENNIIRRFVMVLLFPPIFIFWAVKTFIVRFYQNYEQATRWFINDMRRDFGTSFKIFIKCWDGK